MNPANKAARFLILGAMLTTALNAAAQQAPLNLPATRPAQRHPAPPLAQNFAPPSSQNPAPPSAQNPAPQSTTARFDDWVVQCDSQTARVPAKTCVMVQVAQVQGNNLPFSRVTLARPEKGQAVKLVVQVPVNVSFATNLRIQFGGADQGLSAPFAGCVPAGCFGEFALTEETIKKLHATAGAGKLTFRDASGHDIDIPLSFKGFAGAFDTLAKE
jgi:invasion protein IalB